MQLFNIALKEEALAKLYEVVAELLLDKVSTCKSTENISRHRLRSLFLL